MPLRIFTLDGVDFQKDSSFNEKREKRKMTILRELRKIKLTILQELHITKSTRTDS